MWQPRFKNYKWLTEIDYYNKLSVEQKAFIDEFNLQWFKKKGNDLRSEITMNCHKFDKTRKKTQKYKDGKTLYPKDTNQYTSKDYGVTILSFEKTFVEYIDNPLFIPTPTTIVDSNGKFYRNANHVADELKFRFQIVMEYIETGDPIKHGKHKGLRLYWYGSVPAEVKKVEKVGFKLPKTIPAGIKIIDSNGRGYKSLYQTAKRLSLQYSRVAELLESGEEVKMGKHKGLRFFWVKK